MMDATGMKEDLMMQEDNKKENGYGYDMLRRGKTERSNNKIIEWRKI